MNVAIIPARGGSKRIPRKNIRDFGGRPIIAHSIQAAHESGLFAQILVSTDDEEIAAVARKHGADVPFMRPPELADDHTGTHAVIGHAMRWLLDQGHAVTHGCCIYPTAPFIQADDLERGLSLLSSGGWNAVLAATTFPHTIYRSFERLPEGGLRMVFPEHYATRSQDLPEVFHDAGQFSWATADAWLGPSARFNDRTSIVVLPRWRVQDIDTAEDWKRAEMIWDMLHG